MDPGGLMVVFGRIVLDGIIWDIVKAIASRYVGLEWAQRIYDRIILNQPSTPVIWFRDPMKRARFAAFAIVIIAIGGLSLSRTPELASDELVTQKEPIKEMHGRITPRDTTEIVFMTPYKPDLTDKNGTTVEMQPCTCVDTFPLKPRKPRR